MSEPRIMNESKAKNKPKNQTLRLVAVALGALGLGVLITLFLPLDPFGMRGGSSQAEVETSSSQVGPSEASSMKDMPEEEDLHEGHDHGTLWTCGMHPQVLEDEPGQCPICGMNLTPVAEDMEPEDIKPEDRGESAARDGERELLFYRNPMDPTVTSPVPAKDSMGMDYVPVYREEAASGTAVRIDPAVVQNMNVLTAPVVRRDLTEPVRTVGYLEYDHESMVTVTTKYSGWVEDVYVSHIGEEVHRGQPLFEIYSPELVQTEQELLSALDFARQLASAPEDARRRAESLVESARLRLSYWDVSPDQIRRLEETGKVFRTLTVFAPSTGIVMERMMGLEGMAVTPGMQIFQVADLSTLLLSVELFEGQLAWIRHGTPAEAEFTYFPGETFRGEVHLLEPGLSEETRTLKAKIGIPNSDGRLRQGMYATVHFAPVVVRQAIAVPAEAILRTGQRNVVVVALGEGHFEPREVLVGHEAEGYAQILEGLEEGLEVVTSAQFLLDSESKLREAIQRIIAQRSKA